MKRLGILLCVVSLTGLLANVSMTHNNSMVTTTAVQRLQPFVIMQGTFDSTTGASVGGIVKVYVAKSTDTLKIGDVVFIDTLNAVSKSATIANYNKLAGVVVGGRSTSMQASIASADNGSTAALPNRPVLVLRSGRYWVKVDTAVAGLTAGGLIRPSIYTAGLVQAKPAALDSLYRVVGRSLNGGAASAVVLAEISAR